MITIEKLYITPQADKLIVKVNTVFTKYIVKALFWTKDTFKDYSQAVDLSQYLMSIDNKEVLEICPEDVGLISFDSIYFLEFEDTNQKQLVCTDNNPVGPPITDCDQDQSCCGNKTSDCEPTDSWTELGVVANFSKYHACLLDKVMNLEFNGCEIEDKGECPSNVNYISSLIHSLNLAVQYGYYEEAFKIIKTLDKICCNGCSNCEDFKETLMVNGTGFGVYDGNLMFV